MYETGLGRFVGRDDVPLGVLLRFPLQTYPDGYNMYMGYFIPEKLDPSGLEACLCGADITDAMAEHLNDFVSQAQDDLNPIWGVGVSPLQSAARANGWHGPFGKDVDSVNGQQGCGTGPCVGTATLCDMCISQFHIDHIMIMVYIAESYGRKTARSAGQWNESYVTGFITEGTEFEGSSDPVSNADLKFNEVAICISRALKHADENRGVTDKVTRAEICNCTKKVGAADRAAIAKKPAKRGKTGYQNCDPCPIKIAKPNGLRIPPIDL
jgi:hypothetical protein